MKRIYCNKCGHEIKFINGIAHEDYVFVSKEWGYFLKKMERHRNLWCVKDASRS